MTTEVNVVLISKNSITIDWSWYPTSKLEVIITTHAV